jgi:cephalosporin hydroxylase
MRLTIDTEARTLTREVRGEESVLDLYSKEAFEAVSREWLRIGWNEKYTYTFSWMGRPIIQLPDDLVRIQEAIYQVKPDALIETGVAHGGSLVYYAGLFKAMGKGRAIGIDIEIRPHNRRAIEAHEMSPFITLVEGNSIAPETVRRVHSLVQPGETAMVVLDSRHTKNHVRAELEAYHDLVTPGSYIVATDGCQMFLHDVPRGKPEWAWDHAAAAAEEFAREREEFEIVQPPWPFNESDLTENVTHWPKAWLRRK